MRTRWNKIKGILGTVIFHTALLFLFIFFGLSTPLPLPGEEGVEVNLGSSEEGMGQIQKEQPAPAEEVTPPPPAEQEQKKEEMITQDVEEAPALEKPKEKEKPVEKVVEQPVKKEPAEEIPEEKPPEKPTVNPRALYKGKSEQANEGGQEGITGQPGDQGNTNGIPDAQGYEGQGGAGEGISYSLGGRGAKTLPKPSYNSNDQGKVVVSIQVDRQGNVVSALPGAKGTTISDQKLWQLARDAALRSTFSPDPGAPEVQGGTITYNFIRMN